MKRKNILIIIIFLLLIGLIQYLVSKNVPFWKAGDRFSDAPFYDAKKAIINIITYNIIGLILIIKYFTKIKLIIIAFILFSIIPLFHENIFITNSNLSYRIKDILQGILNIYYYTINIFMITGNIFSIIIFCVMNNINNKNTS